MQKKLFFPKPCWTSDHFSPCVPEEYWENYISPCKEFPEGVYVDCFGLLIDFDHKPKQNEFMHQPVETAIGLELVSEGDDDDDEEEEEEDILNKNQEDDDDIVNEACDFQNAELATVEVEGVIAGEGRGDEEDDEEHMEDDDDDNDEDDDNDDDDENDNVEEEEEQEDQEDDEKRETKIQNVIETDVELVRRSPQKRTKI